MPKTESTSIRLPPKLVKAVDRQAAKEGRSRANLIRRALQMYVDEHSKNGGPK